MVRRVDNDPASDAPSGRGSDKKLFDELLWERPSVSLLYTPKNVWNYSEGGYIGLGTGEELVTFSTGGSIDVTWDGETTPHAFALDFTGIMDPGNGVRSEEQVRRQTVYIAGKTKGTVFHSLTLVDANHLAQKSISASSCVNENGFKLNGSDWEVSENNQGVLSCDLGLALSQSGTYTLKMDASSGALLVNIGRVPGMAFVPGAFIPATGNDWEQNLTFKNRRPQKIVDVPNPTPAQIDNSVADMVDYHRSTLLIVNTIPRVLQMEVDDLQPDRLNKLSIDLNFGTASIEYDAINDPNTFSKIPNKASGFPFLDHPAGLVDPAQELYTMTIKLGGTTKVVTVPNPVDAWGHLTLDFAKLEIQSGMAVHAFQPFLEGRNHMRVYVENRWQMNRVQDLNLFIPGPPPTIEPVFPMADEAFCGTSKLEFVTDLIYNQAATLAASDVEASYLSANGVTNQITNFVVTKMTGFNTKYLVQSVAPVAWPAGDLGLKVKVQPYIGSTPTNPVNFTYQIHQDCIVPTVAFALDQELYNPSSIRFDVFDQATAGGEMKPVQDLRLELQTLAGVSLATLSTEMFAAPGAKVRNNSWSGANNTPIYPEGRYKLVLRAHDNTIKDNPSDTARKLFWTSYTSPNGPDLTLPFAAWCSGLSTCMTQWAKDEKIIFLDFTPPTISSVTYAPLASSGTVVYAGSATSNDLKVSVILTDALSTKEHPPQARIEMIPVDALNVALPNTAPVVIELKNETPTSNGPFTLSNVILKAQDALVRSLTGGAQVFPEGIYSAKIIATDAARNRVSSAATKVIVDLTAPRILNANVPYAPDPGSVHTVQFSVDELDDAVALQQANLSLLPVQVTADCGGAAVHYTEVQAISVGALISYKFTGTIPTNYQGECLVTIGSQDARGNARTSENRIVVDRLPPEITSPATGNEISGRVAIHGIADDPSLNSGAGFSWYDLSYVPLNANGDPDGAWQSGGVTVPDLALCVVSMVNRGCKPVSKASKTDILGYWNTGALTAAQRNKVYRLMLTTSDGTTSLNTSVDVFVPGVTATAPTITLDPALPTSIDFSLNSDFPISWQVVAPPASNAYQVRMEITRVNSKGEKINTVLSRLLEGIVPDVFWGKPTVTTNRGVYVWLDAADQVAGQTSYRVRLVSGTVKTKFQVTMQGLALSSLTVVDGNHGALPGGVNVFSSGIQSQGSTLVIGRELVALTSEEYLVTTDSHSGLDWSLATNNVQFAGGSYQGQPLVPLYAPGTTDEYAFLGSQAVGIGSQTGTSLIHLPSLLNGRSLIWDGKRDQSLSSVPSGKYRIRTTLEGLADGQTATDDAMVQVTGVPVQITGALATPREVTFGKVLPQVSLSFVLDQDALVTVFVRAQNGGAPTDLQQSMSIAMDGNTVPLTKQLLAGRSTAYTLNWDGRYGNNMLLTPNATGYEFVIQAYDVSNGALLRTATAPFAVVSKDMAEDAGNVLLFVDGDPNTTRNIGGLDYQIAQGLNDLVIQAAPEGTRVVNESVPVLLQYQGTQLLPQEPFQRYSVGVQIHKQSIEFWAVAATSFHYRHESKVFCVNGDAYSNRVQLGSALFTENAPGTSPSPVEIRLNFDSGESGTDMDGFMGKSNVHLLLIPKYLLSYSEVSRMVREINAADFADMDQKWKNLTQWSAASFSWKPSTVTKVFTKTASELGGLFSSARQSWESWMQSATDDGTQRLTNSTEINWDPACDVGKDQNECLAVGDKVPGINGSTGRGNGVADEGEPTRVAPGSVKVEFNPEQHGADFKAQAWAWKNTEGESKEWVQDWCSGCDDCRHDLEITFHITPSDRFWSHMTSTASQNDYGWNNLVNRYLTVDPMNPFMFSASGAFPLVTKPFISPSSGVLSFLLSNTIPTSVASQFFIQGLHNPSFQVIGDNGTQVDVTKYNTLANDVQMGLHFFKIGTTSRKYSPAQFTVSTELSGIATAVQTGDINQAYAISSPIALGGVVSSQNLKISVDLNSGTLINNPPGYKALWPLTIAQRDALVSPCAAAGCGASETDVKLVTTNAEVTDPSLISANGDLNVLITARLGLLADGTSGFDLSPYMKKGATTWQTLQGPNNELVLTQATNVTITTMEKIVAPAGFEIGADNILRKMGAHNGYPYIPYADPLLAKIDDDGDGKVAEDASNNFVDDDGDLAVDEDPMNAIRLRVPGAFPFVAGGATALKLTYQLSALIGAKADAQSVIPGTSDNTGWSILQRRNGSWIDAPNMLTKWESGNLPRNFVSTKLFYKDGRPHDDVVIYGAESMDNVDATKAKLIIAQAPFNGRDRRVLQIQGQMPWKTGDQYQIFISSDEGWQELTKTRVPPVNSTSLTGTLAYWDVKTSGLHQIMLVRNTNGAKYYKIFRVAVFSENAMNGAYSDALGRAQVSLGSGTSNGNVDVVPLGPSEIPQTIPSEGVMGPVVKVYPATLLTTGNTTLRLRYTRDEVVFNNWTEDASIYVVAQGYSPRRLSGVTWSFYTANNTAVTTNVNTGTSNWDYAVIAGVVSASQATAAKPQNLQVPMGETQALGQIAGAAHSIAIEPVSQGLYNVTVQSAPQVRSMHVGESQYFDLDGVAGQDLKVTLVSVQEGVAVLRSEALQGLPPKLEYFYALQGHAEPVAPIELQPTPSQTEVNPLRIQGISEPGKTLQLYLGSLAQWSKATQVSSAVFQQQGSNFQVNVPLNLGVNHVFVAYAPGVMGARATAVIERVVPTVVNLLVDLDPLGSADVRKTALWVQGAPVGILDVIETIRGEPWARTQLAWDSSQKRMEAANNQTDAVERSLHVSHLGISGEVDASKTLVVPTDDQAPVYTRSDAITRLTPGVSGVAQVTGSFSDDQGIRWAWIRLLNAQGQELNRTFVELAALKAGKVQVEFSTMDAMILKVMAPGGGQLGTQTLTLPAQDLLRGRDFALELGVTDRAGNRSSVVRYTVNAFTYQKELNIPLLGAVPTQDVVNYPLLVRLTSAEVDFATASKSGSDVRILDAVNEDLDFDLERWDASAQKGDLWVRIARIAAGTTSLPLHVLWGNAFAEASGRSTSVWDDGFRGVYHFNEAYLGPYMPEADYDSYAVYAKGDAEFHERANLTGAIAASGVVRLGDDSKIVGDVWGGLGVNPGARVQISGKTQEGGLDPLNMTIDPPPAPGSRDIAIATNATMTLLPGKYRDISVGAGSRVTLSMGTYHFRNLQFAQDVHVNIDLSSGPVVVKVAGTWNVLERSQVLLVGRNQASMVRWDVASASDAIFGTDVLWKGVLTAPLARVVIADRMHWKGALYANALVTGTDVVFTPDLPQARYASMPPSDQSFPPVTVAGFALFGKKGVVIPNNTQLTGRMGSSANLSLGNDAHLTGDLWVWKDLSLGNQSVVTGSVLLGGALQQGANVQWSGSVVPLTEATDYVIPAVSVSAGNTAVNVNNDQSTVLAPGAFGAVTVGSRGKLLVSAGVYHFASLTAATDAQFQVDLSHGPVELRVDGAASFGARTQFVRSSTTKFEDLMLSFGGTSAVTFGDDIQLQAAIRAPNAEVSTGRTQLTGTLWADRVILGDGARFTAGSSATIATTLPEVATSFTSEWIADATRYRHNGTNVKSTAQKGIIAESQVFSPTTGITFMPASYMGVGQGSWSSWVKSDAVSGRFWSSAVSVSPPWELTRNSAGNLQVRIGANVLECAMPIDTWFHMAVVQDASLLHLYINGVQLASTGLGALYPPATPWIGSPNVAKTVSLDEVRLSETARSLDWVRLDYLTQKSTITTTTPSVQIAGARRN